jgi:phage baseplate assembly protein W
MADLLPTSVDGSNAIYADVNPRFGSNRYSELIYDEVAVTQSIINLLTCPIGDRGRIGNCTYGTAHFATLHEPMVPMTAMTLKAQVIQSLQKWEPRIQVLNDQTSCTVDFSLPGYKLVIAYLVLISNRITKTTVYLPVAGQS